MHDPKEEKKGGFGAFVQRDRERREAEELKNASANGATSAAASPAQSTPGSKGVSGRLGHDLTIRWKAARHALESA